MGLSTGEMGEAFGNMTKKHRLAEGLLVNLLLVRGVFL